MKGAINPLLWILLLQLACWWILQRRGPANAIVTRMVLLLTVVSLWGFSTPLVHRVLERSLALPETESTAVEPKYLLVLAGGWRPGATPEEDFLELENQRRVVHGAHVWRRYPDARLVLSGVAGAYGEYRSAVRQVELMADVARRWGVPEGAIVLESRSADTRAHPVEALKLPGIAPPTPIGIVTSGWHMRRAHREFCRYFDNLALYPVGPMYHRRGWRQLIPDARALRDNGTFLQEWIAVLWYDLRARIQDGTGDLRCRG